MITREPVTETEPEEILVRWKDDCVFKTKNGWFFYDETYWNHGPYETEHEARIDLALYCHFELGC